MVDLNSLIPAADQVNWELEDGLSINDSGQITGRGTFGGKNHAFLLTPLGPATTPEPGAWGLFAAATTIGLTLRRRRRRQK